MDTETSEPNGHEFIEPNDKNLAEALLSDAAESGDLEAFLKSVGLEAPAQIEMTKEEVEAIAAAHEKAKSYDAAAGKADLQIRLDVARKRLVELLESLHLHLNAEWDAAVKNENKDLKDSLFLSEAPRWYQLAVQDLQVGFMKLDRCLNHQQGL